jgi:hypothetical protein
MGRLFAYAQAGFVVGHANEVRVWDSKIDGPRWWRPLASEIVAVGSSGGTISTLESNGTLALWNAADGMYTGGAQLTHAYDLAAGPQGVAVATASGIEMLDANGRRAIGVRDVSALRYSQDGTTLGVGFGDGRVTFVEIATGKPLHEGRIPGGAVTSIAERVPGRWLASAGSEIHLVAGDGVKRITGLGGTTIRDVTYGPRPSLFGLVADNIAIALEWPSLDTICSNRYPDKTPLGVAFGPPGDDGFYIGLSGGDGNRRDLRAGDLYRTDPHPGHVRNRWLVMPGFEAAVATRALATDR